MKTTKLLTALAAALVFAACGNETQPGDTYVADVQGTSTANDPVGEGEVDSEEIEAEGEVEDEGEYVEVEDEDEVEDVDETQEVEDELENEHDFAAGLEFMREEEKLARDVYIYFGEKYQLQIFLNIQESEESHTTAVYDLLDKYDIPDPAYDTDLGEFTNQDLQAIYDQLIARGSTSATDALLVGAYIEEHDILDLDERLDEDDLPDDVRETYASLRDGSTNHLKAFVSNLERSGVTYTPQLMDVDAYEEAVR